MTPAVDDLNATPPEQPTTPIDGQNRKVLVIEDSDDIRMLIAETLSLFGFTPLTAEDGISGVQVAQENCPDLIICDINMPNLDGYGTLTALRELEKTATIPFIFLSGASDKLNMRRGMELGADDYLTKPFTHKELLSAVNTRLEKQAELQRQSDKKLDELRGNITLALPHELRTPLNGILGLASILMDDYATLPPDEVFETARCIHESALRLHRLIENFLVFSQIELMASESKKIETASLSIPVPVQTFIPEIAQNIAKRYKRENDLTTLIQPADLLIPSDNFQKIIEELVDNAFKFSEAGQPVKVTNEISGGRMIINVINQGRGMTAEQISKIAPHMQFDRKIYEQQGAGLGLVIAKKMTELLGGNFKIESKPGVETTAQFSFDMPGL